MKYIVVFFFQLLAVFYLIKGIYDNDNFFYKNKFLILLSYIIILFGLVLILYFLRSDKK